MSTSRRMWVLLCTPRCIGPVCVPAQVRQMIADGHPWFAEMAGPQWSLLELPTGHGPTFSAPHRLADLLHGLREPR
jgi:hypothetical protein